MLLRSLSVFSLLLVLCVNVSCTETSGGSVSLAEPAKPATAARARAESELPPDSAAQTIQHYPMLERDGLLESPAVLVLEGTDITPVSVQVGVGIDTWQELEVVRELRSASDPDCESATVPQEIRPGIRSGRRRVAMRLEGGSVLTDKPYRSVSVGLAGFIRFQARKQYLVFGELCAGVLELAFGPQGLFVVDRDGAIATYLEEQAELPSQQAIVALGSIDRLAAALTKHER